MEKERIGKVFTYFSKVGVAGIELIEGPISVGDTISIEGTTTNLKQKVESIEINMQVVKMAEAGQSVGILVKERVRANDVVYKLNIGE